MRCDVQHRETCLCMATVGNRGSRAPLYACPRFTPFLLHEEGRRECRSENEPRGHTQKQGELWTYVKNTSPRERMMPAPATSPGAVEQLQRELSVSLQEQPGRCDKGVVDGPVEKGGPYASPRPLS